MGTSFILAPLTLSKENKLKYCPQKYDIMHLPFKYRVNTCCVKREKSVGTESIPYGTPVLISAKNTSVPYANVKLSMR